MLDQYLGVIITFGFAAVIVGIMCGASMILGVHHPGPVKQQVFECGNPPTGPARGRFSVRFYLVASLFIVFDDEVVFLYPSAIVFCRLVVPGLVEMVVFVGVLAAGPADVWENAAQASD